VRVSTKNSLSTGLFSVAERALCYLCRQAQPSGVETVKVAGKTFFPGIEFLKPEKNQLSKMGDAEILDRKAVELMTVNGQVLFSRVNPFILLEHPYAHQM
jgi:hypothetical protein